MTWLVTHFLRGFPARGIISLLNIPYSPIRQFQFHLNWVSRLAIDKVQTESVLSMFCVRIATHRRPYADQKCRSLWNTCFFVLFKEAASMHFCETNSWQDQYFPHEIYWPSALAVSRGQVFHCLRVFIHYLHMANKFCLTPLAFISQDEISMYYSLHLYSFD